MVFCANVWGCSLLMLGNYLATLGKLVLGNVGAILG